ncbi:response regulator [Acidimangrovimonas pyrenivorans]|uniref:PleD family two-component system response regulator n=2 Tax=Pseudomonadota TaxID=1224 RepID=A0ABV7AIY1_9RHOB
MKILAVDDDPLFLDVLKEVLASAGQQDVALATSAVEAAKLISEAEPAFDVCFIDIRMPEIEGDYLCKWVRRLPQYHDKAIVMLTARKDKADIDRAFAAGASDYVTKPVDFGDFIDKVKEIEHRLRRERQGAQPMRPTTRVPSRPGIDFALPLALDDVKGAIEIGALENYLLKLSESQTHQMTAVALKVVDAAKLHLTCTPGDYVQLLETVAKGILKTLGVSGAFISYAGYGAFVCVAEDPRIADWTPESLEAAVAKTLEGMGAPKTDLCASPPLKLGRWSGRKVADAMYRTIGDAEARCSMFRIEALSGVMDGLDEK